MAGFFDGVINQGDASFADEWVQRLDNERKKEKAKYDKNIQAYGNIPWLQPLMQREEEIRRAIGQDVNAKWIHGPYVIFSLFAYTALTTAITATSLAYTLTLPARRFIQAVDGMLGGGKPFSFKNPFKALGKVIGAVIFLPHFLLDKTLAGVGLLDKPLSALKLLPFFKPITDGLRGGIDDFSKIITGKAKAKDIGSLFGKVLSSPFHALSHVLKQVVYLPLLILGVPENSRKDAADKAGFIPSKIGKGIQQFIKSPIKTTSKVLFFVPYSIYKDVKKQGLARTIFSPRLWMRRRNRMVDAFDKFTNINKYITRRFDSKVESYDYTAVKDGEINADGTLKDPPKKVRMQIGVEFSEYEIDILTSPEGSPIRAKRGQDRTREHALRNRRYGVPGVPGSAAKLNMETALYGVFRATNKGTLFKGFMDGHKFKDPDELKGAESTRCYLFQRVVKSFYTRPQTFVREVRDEKGYKVYLKNGKEVSYGHTPEEKERLKEDISAGAVKTKKESIVCTPAEAKYDKYMWDYIDAKRDNTLRKDATFLSFEAWSMTNMEAFEGLLKKEGVPLIHKKFDPAFWFGNQGGSYGWFKQFHNNRLIIRREIIHVDERGGHSRVEDFNLRRTHTVLLNPTKGNIFHQDIIDVANDPRVDRLRPELNPNTKDLSRLSRSNEQYDKDTEDHIKNAHKEYEARAQDDISNKVKKYTLQIRDNIHETFFTNNYLNDDYLEGCKKDLSPEKREKVGNLFDLAGMDTDDFLSLFQFGMVDVGATVSPILLRSAILGMDEKETIGDKSGRIDSRTLVDGNTTINAQKNGAEKIFGKGSTKADRARVRGRVSTLMQKIEEDEKRSGGADENAEYTNLARYLVEQIGVNSNKIDLSPSSVREKAKYIKAFNRLLNASDNVEKINEEINVIEQSGGSLEELREAKSRLSDEMFKTFRRVTRDMGQLEENIKGREKSATFAQRGLFDMMMSTVVLKSHLGTDDAGNTNIPDGMHPDFKKLMVGKDGDIVDLMDPVWEPTSYKKLQKEMSLYSKITNWDEPMTDDVFTTLIPRYFRFLYVTECVKDPERMKGVSMEKFFTMERDEDGRAVPKGQGALVDKVYRDRSSVKGKQERYGIINNPGISGMFNQLAMNLKLIGITRSEDISLEEAFIHPKLDEEKNLRSRRPAQKDKLILGIQSIDESSMPILTEGFDDGSSGSSSSSSSGSADKKDSDAEHITQDEIVTKIEDIISDISSKAGGLDSNELAKVLERIRKARIDMIKAKANKSIMAIDKTIGKIKPLNTTEEIKSADIKPESIGNLNKELGDLLKDLKAQVKSGDIKPDSILQKLLKKIEDVFRSPQQEQLQGQRTVEASKLKATQASTNITSNVNPANDTQEAVKVGKKEEQKFEFKPSEQADNKTKVKEEKRLVEKLDYKSDMARLRAAKNVLNSSKDGLFGSLSENDIDVITNYSPIDVTSDPASNMHVLKNKTAIVSAMAGDRDDILMDLLRDETQNPSTKNNNLQNLNTKLAKKIRLVRDEIIKQDPDSEIAEQLTEVYKKLTNPSANNKPSGTIRDIAKLVNALSEDIKDSLGIKGDEEPDNPPKIEEVKAKTIGAKVNLVEKLSETIALSFKIFEIDPSDLEDGKSAKQEIFANLANDKHEGPVRAIAKKDLEEEEEQNEEAEEKQKGWVESVVAKFEEKQKAIEQVKTQAELGESGEQEKQEESSEKDDGEDKGKAQKEAQKMTKLQAIKIARLTKEAQRRAVITKRAVEQKLATQKSKNVLMSKNRTKEDNAKAEATKDVHDQKKENKGKG